MDLSALAASMGLSSVNISNALKDDDAQRRARKPSDRSDVSTASSVCVTLDTSSFDGAEGTIRVNLDVSALVEGAPPAI